MSGNKVYLVEGDNLPLLTVGVTKLDGTDADLTGATSASVFMIEKDVDGAIAVEVPVDTIDTVNSTLSFDFPDGVLVPGEFWGEVVIMFGALQQTLYKPLSIHVRARYA